MTTLKQSILIATMLLLIPLFTPGVYAQALEYYGVEVTIQDDLTVNNLVVMDFENPVSHLDYILDFKIENLEYEADFDFADCTLDTNNGGSTVSCDFIGITEAENKLTLNFNTRNVIKKAGDNYRFTVNYGVPLPIQNSFILFRLPQNNILAGDLNESVFPNTGGILSDGRHIMVFWEEEALESGENLAFSVLFTRPAVSTDFLGMFMYLVAIMTVVILVVVFFYFKRIKRAKVAVVKSVLNKDEKRIIDILNQRDGKAGQKILVRETDFSKAKVSRIIRVLKDRGVVDTEPISGRENRVFLKLGKEDSPKKPS